jgi:uncharacterized protein YtpQ (UPF0354 family)
MDALKHCFRILLVALCIAAGCSKGVLSPNDFTAEYSEYLQARTTNLQVKIDRELELRLVKPNGTNVYRQFLGNAYDIYKADPTKKAEVMERYAGSCLAGIATMTAPLERTRIVPMVKNRDWLDEVKKAAAHSGKKSGTIFEDLNPDLIVVYAEDFPDNMRFLTPPLLETAAIDRKELRELACNNLRKILPEIKYNGANGFYMITAGGDYEASLLLLDSIWTDKKMDIKGDIVVGIPAREFLLVGDTSRPAAVERLRGLVEKAYQEGTYKLSPKLFVRRNGSWLEYDAAK